MDRLKELQNNLVLLGISDQYFVLFYFAKTLVENMWLE